MQQARLLRSGYGSVGRAVASDTRGPQFEYSNQAKFYTEHVLRLTVEKMKKVTGNDPFLNNYRRTYYMLYFSITILYYSHTMTYSMFICHSILLCSHCLQSVSRLF